MYTRKEIAEQIENENDNELTKLTKTNSLTQLTQLSNHQKHKENYYLLEIS